MSQGFSQSIPHLTTADGAVRRLGVELEFTGVSLHQAAEVLAQFTGDLTRQSLVVWTGQHPELGKFQLELDWEYLKTTAKEHDLDPEQDAWMEFIQQAASLVVPIEIVCPPIPLDAAPVLEELVSALRRQGAQGTDDSIVAAYGVHLNVEVPDMDANLLLRYLKAFALLQWWLSDAHEVDFTRKLSPYVNLFPEAYVREILAVESTDWQSLIRHYMEHNDTRNRALDMYPMFAEFDEDFIQREMQDPRIKKRPAFHYRLPNCEIGRADWSLAEPWSLWCVVERLADDAALLAELSEAFTSQERFLLGVSRRQWIDYLDQWLRDRSLV